MRLILQQCRLFCQRIILRDQIKTRFQGKLLLGNTHKRDDEHQDQKKMFHWHSYKVKWLCGYMAMFKLNHFQIIKLTNLQIVTLLHYSILMESIKSCGINFFRSSIILLNVISSISNRHFTRPGTAKENAVRENRFKSSCFGSMGFNMPSSISLAICLLNGPGSGIHFVLK